MMQILRRHRIAKRNEDIKKAVLDFADKGLSITPQAYNKMLTCVDDFSDILKLSNAPSQELAFYLLGDDNRLINDVYLGHDQVVLPAYCNITRFGSMKSIRDIRANSEKNILGWGHSHGSMANFFSSIDLNTMHKFPQDNENIVDIEGEDVLISYGLVVNNRHDEPYCCAQVVFPQYTLSEGNEIKTLENVLVPAIPFVQEGESSCENIDTDEIYNRVTVNNHTLVRPSVETPFVLEENVTLDDVVDEAIVESRDDAGTLTERLSVDDYARLERLESLQRSMQSYVTGNSTSYVANMTRYAAVLEQSNNPVNQAASTIATMLSGSYRENGKRLWKWEDRLDAVETYMASNTATMYIDDLVKEQILDVAKNNRYLRSKRGEQLERLGSIFKDKHYGIAA